MVCCCRYSRGERYPDHYVVDCDDPETLEGPVFWLSYLAKERSKLQTVEGTRNYSTSKLGCKTQHS
ncbi:hypothetical protein EQH51_01640 [Klebsiella pneumoniae]|nr:hypothetical protein [Klebsiella pneumoniae]OYJ15282.1 hypothetical protein CI740_09265 [Klebsiella pneumoniae subsp. pneumoniae]KAB7535536.1 hypothetical protein GBV82_10775 [Klebsiella pneumoniae]MBK2407992.1 hypothetical protein [Klebsiella pneumoniae]MBZ6915819.1 hypothetical protein [Klebsiella pneumoniae]